MGKCIRDALCDRDICTGCMACVNTCRHGAIQIGIDIEGFYRPSVDAEKCIDCGLCYNICPQIHPLKKLEYRQTAFHCYHKDFKIRRKSSSGGLFSAVGDKIISGDGICYGVKLDDSLKAIFSSSDTDGNTTDCYKGSKYVQAQVKEDTFKNVRRYLAQGKIVLFSGTPCQVAGLKKFLGHDYDNLYTMDFLCHESPHLIYSICIRNLWKICMAAK